MDLRIATIKNKDGSTEVYFVGIEHRDDFDLLLGLLQQENNCQILSNQELLYVRKAELQKNEADFQLIHDDMMGNYLYTEDNLMVPLLEQLAKKVVASIKAKLESQR